MSKKTNDAKQKRTTRPRRRARKHLNPIATKTARNKDLTTAGLLFNDPFFMHYVAGALFRAMELTGKFPPPPSLQEPSEIDAEFVPFEGAKPQ